MIGEGGITDEEMGEFCDSQKSRKGGITYVCERTGRIFREDIKVCKTNIAKDFCPEPKKTISWLAHVQFSLPSNWLKRKGTIFISPNFMSRESACMVL